MLCRLNAPLMVLAYRDNHQAAITIPVGRTIDFVGPAHDDRFSVVKSEGEEFLAFKGDLRDRATPLTWKPATKEDTPKLERVAGWKVQA